MNYSLYIHIPFCTHRCAYCDFNTYAGQEGAIAAYVDALRREIEFIGEAVPERIRSHTVFFGGGTPTLLSSSQFKTILDSIRRCFDLTEDAEITTEANPGTVSYRALGEMRGMGINRISFGAQSANGEELKMLERAHSFRDVIEAVTSARRAGFENLNLDLIYGLPEQALETWKRTVRRILDLQPEHISAYALTLEHGAPFGRWAARGLLPIPDADAAAEMYEWASEELQEAGYEQYEISNWGRSLSALRPVDNGPAARSDVQLPAKEEALGRQAIEQPKFACRHNLQYWRGLPYLGMGAGAHGYAGGHRYSNVLRIKTYIERMMAEPRAGVSFPLSPAAVNQHRQTAGDDMSEFMITGLRLTLEGVSTANFERRFGRELMDVYAKQILRLTANGLLEWGEEAIAPGAEATVLKLTKRGRLLGNRAFMEFV